MTVTFFSVLQLSVLLLPHATARFVTSQSDLLASDTLTALGSAFDSGADKRTVTIIGIGFNYCGLDIVEEVLSKHSETITVLSNHSGSTVGRDLSTQYFLPEAAGTYCNRSPATVGSTPYQRYVNDCFKGRVAGAGQTYVDITGDYLPFTSDGVPSRLKEIGNETALRFIAVACDPRARAVTSVKKHLRAEKKRAGGTFLDEGVLDALHHHETEGFDGSIAVGEYATMLEAWLQFFPPESLLVVNAGGLKNFDTWKRIFSHTGLSVPKESTFQEWVKDATVGDRMLFKHIDLEVKQKLNEHYGKHDPKLWQILNSEFW